MRGTTDRVASRRQRLLIFLSAVILLAGTLPRLFQASFSGRVRPNDPPGEGQDIDLRSVHVNRAGEEELAALPGIGPVLAMRIVEERSRGGDFTSPGDLERVRGIGPVRAGLLETYLLFDPRPGEEMLRPALR